MKGFSISNHESMAGNIRRILLAQFDYIKMQAENSQEDIHKSIHETRKSMKRIRAVLRMIRDEIGYSSYYRENVFYRDLSRNLSEIRNYEVLSASIQNLQADLSKTIPSSIFISLDQELNRQREIVSGGPARLSQMLNEMAKKIENARERIDDFPITHHDFRVFEGGLYRMYRQGKKYLLDAREDPSPNLIHDLRKRLKYFWYQVEILQPIFPGPMKAYAGTLETIAEHLGVYHDIQVLQEFLSETNVTMDSRVSETLQEACMAKKNMLLYNFWTMADIAYSEEPRAMVDRMTNYWRVYTNSSYDHTH